MKHIEEYLLSTKSKKHFQFISENYIEVQLSMRNVGLCGSDVYMFKNGSHGTHRLGGSGILGHEASGVVTKVGEGVSNLKVGKNEIVNYYFNT